MQPLGRVSKPLESLPDIPFINCVQFVCVHVGECMCVCVCVCVSVSVLCMCMCKPPDSPPNQPIYMTFFFNGGQTPQKQILYIIVNCTFLIIEE